MRRGLKASEGLLGITSGTAQLSRVLADYFGPKPHLIHHGIALTF